MNNNQESARNLIKRAFDAKEQSTANLLIASAKSLDPQTDVEHIKAEWLEIWLYQNRNRFKAGE